MNLSHGVLHALNCYTSFFFYTEPAGDAAAEHSLLSAAAVAGATATATGTTAVAAAASTAAAVAAAAAAAATGH